MDPVFWIPTRHSLALGAAQGWFIGLLPIFGIQIPLALLIGSYTRSHLPSAVLGTFITNPLTVPAILLLQYWMGNRVLRSFGTLGWFNAFEAGVIARLAIQLLCGGILSASIAGIIGYLGVWIFWGLRREEFVDGVV